MYASVKNFGELSQMKYLLLLNTKDTLEEVEIRNVMDVLPYSSINRRKMVCQNKHNKIVFISNSADKAGNGEPQSGILAMSSIWFYIKKYHDN